MFLEFRRLLRSVNHRLNKLAILDLPGLQLNIMLTGLVALAEILRISWITPLKSVDN